MPTDLKKWSIEQAIASGAQGEDVLTRAEELYKFATESEESLRIPKEIKKAKSLTPKQKEVLKILMEFVKDGKPANGSSIAEHMGVSQSYVSSIIRKLIALGYIGKNGYSFWVLKHPDFD